MAETIDQSQLLDLGRQQVNHTDQNDYGNPVDVATVIDLLEMFVSTQAAVIVLKVDQWSDGDVTFAHAQENFPTLVETKEFIEVLCFFFWYPVYDSIIKA